MNDLQALQSLGLTLPTPAYIFGAVVFGLIGLVAYRRGKQRSHQHTKWIGVALMFYPYAVSATWLLYLVGSALCVGLYVYREG